jgi:hypothetical protein
VDARGSFPQLTDVTACLILVIEKQRSSSSDLRVSFLERIAALWPYVLIVISLVGLAYTFLAASR